MAIEVPVEHVLSDSLKKKMKAYKIDPGDMHDLCGEIHQLVKTDIKVKHRQAMAALQDGVMKCMERAVSDYDITFAECAGLIVFVADDIVDSAKKQEEDNDGN